MRIREGGEFDGMMEASQLRGVCHEVRYTELKLSGISQMTYMQAVKLSDKEAMRSGTQGSSGKKQ